MLFRHSSKFFNQALYYEHNRDHLVLGMAMVVGLKYAKEHATSFWV
jgi:hypothetical protein